MSGVKTGTIDYRAHAARLREEEQRRRERYEASRREYHAQAYQRLRQEAEEKAARRRAAEAEKREKDRAAAERHEQAAQAKFARKRDDREESAQATRAAVSTHAETVRAEVASWRHALEICEVPDDRTGLQKARRDILHRVQALEADARNADTLARLQVVQKKHAEARRGHLRFLELAAAEGVVPTIIDSTEGRGVNWAVVRASIESRISGDEASVAHLIRCCCGSEIEALETQLVQLDRLQVADDVKTEKEGSVRLLEIDRQLRELEERALQRENVGAQNSLLVGAIRQGLPRHGYEVVEDTPGDSDPGSDRQLVVRDQETGAVIRLTLGGDGSLRSEAELPTGVGSPCDAIHAEFAEILDAESGIGIQFLSGDREILQRARRRRTRTSFRSRES